MYSHSRTNKQKKQIDRPENESCLMLILKFFGSIGVAGIVCYLLISIDGVIEAMQVKAFAHSGSLLFVLSAGTLTRFLILFFSLLAIVILFLAFRSANSRKTRVLFGSSILAVLAGVFLYFFLSFDHYYDVTKDTIFYKKGITTKEKSYSIEDVSSVQVSYHYRPSSKGRGTVLIDYMVTMRNWERFNAFNASQFSQNIVEFDKLLTSKGIPITRDPPGDSYLSILCDYEEGKSCPVWIDYIYGLSKPE
ncbi:YdbT family protein [Cohnella abietis]|uniref:Uncharacterized protein n=1 Tax=Cohnella abietis TaxID=2507935 RepID=A0A3T1CZN7_9BACL|nr:hypothetical protein [Cohnella abietis]BBI31225.1 hypothetical protein KCTCHS21_06240 [Cohnella abietis]